MGGGKIKIVPDKKEFHNKVDIVHCLSTWDILLGSECNKLYKKSIIIENNIFFPTHTHDVGEDHIFSRKYFIECNSFISILEICYHYIEISYSLSHFNDTARTNVVNHLGLMQQLLSMKSEIKQIDGRFSFSNYYEYFIDMIIRRLYLYGKPLPNERIGYLKDFKDILFGLEYNPISASKGIFNKDFRSQS